MTSSSTPSPRVQRAARRLRIGLYLVAAALLVVLVVTKVRPVRELFWQWLPIYVQEPGHEHTGHFYLYDPKLGWRNPPGWKAKTRGHTLTINSRGLRDREMPYEKPPGRRRLLVLGDSFAWGYGVADEEIFTEVLERRLQARKKPWDVVNTGVSGWGTDQQYLFLIEEGFRYEPDLVVLAFYTFNDPREVVHSDMYGLSKPLFLDKTLTPANVPVPRPSQAKSGLTSPVDPFELVVTIIEAIQRECRANNCRLVVMKFGTFADPENKGLVEVERRFEKAFARLEDLPYLDLDREFVRRKLKTKFLIAGNEDNHWNEFGHEQVGKILGEFLEETGLLERPNGRPGDYVDQQGRGAAAPRETAP